MTISLPTHNARTCVWCLMSGSVKYIVSLGGFCSDPQFRNISWILCRYTYDFQVNSDKNVTAENNKAELDELESELHRLNEMLEAKGPWFVF